MRYEAFTTAIDQHAASLAAASKANMSSADEDDGNTINSAGTGGQAPLEVDAALAATALVELVCSAPRPANLRAAKEQTKPG